MSGISQVNKDPKFTIDNSILQLNAIGERKRMKGGRRLFNRLLLGPRIKQTITLMRDRQPPRNFSRRSPEAPLALRRFWYASPIAEPSTNAPEPSLGTCNDRQRSLATLNLHICILLLSPPLVHFPLACRKYGIRIRRIIQRHDLFSVEIQEIPCQN